MSPKPKETSSSFLGEPVGVAEEEKKSTLDFDPKNAVGVASEGEAEDMDPGIFQKALNMVDIPGSIVRTGLEAAISPERDVLSSVGEQIGKTIESPFTAAASAPTGWDIADTASAEMFGNEPRPEPEGIIETGVRAVADFVPGFAIEMATDPLGMVLGGAKKVKNIIRRPLLNSADKQAMQALAKYTSKSDVIGKGKDVDIIGRRLVEENLQGLLKTPQKLFEKMTGKRHVEKKLVPGLEEYSFKRGPKEGGLIKETSEAVSDVIKSIEDDYGIKNIIPADIISNQIEKAAAVIKDPTSGESPDIGKIQEILNKVLKPYSMKPSVGGYGIMTEKVPNKLTLSQVQQLRKNIGKQLADRTFYAAPDQNMALEKDVLTEAWRELGDVIRNNLKGKPIKRGNKIGDAADYYDLQNEKLKAYLDLESMLEYVPTEQLKDQDMLSLLASIGVKGATWGTAGGLASLVGAPSHMTSGALIGATLGAGRAAEQGVKAKAPEYLADIMKQAAKVAPIGAAVGQRGAIQFMRDGQFVPESNMGRSPQSINFTPKELINYRLPRTTQGILENKDKVLAKLVQNGLDDNTIDTIAQALNGDPEDVANLMPQLSQQFGYIFEKSKYKVFDGKFIDPNDKARAADDISKRDDLNSIQRAKMISKINKNNEMPEGL
jgi:hypothetical protein